MRLARLLGRTCWHRGATLSSSASAAAPQPVAPAWWSFQSSSRGWADNLCLPAHYFSCHLLPLAQLSAPLLLADAFRAGRACQAGVSVLAQRPIVFMLYRIFCNYVHFVGSFRNCRRGPSAHVTSITDSCAAGNGAMAVPQYDHACPPAGGA